MCNIRTITYACSHTVSFRLTTCRGHFTSWRKKAAQPQCSPGPSLAFKSSQPCGICAKDVADKQLEAEYETLRRKSCAKDWLAEPSEDLARLETDYARAKWLLEISYPRSGQKNPACYQKGPRATRGETLLKREVRAEEVVSRGIDLRAAVSGLAWDDAEAWGPEWHDLGQDVEAVQPDEGEQEVADDTPRVMDWGTSHTCWDLQAGAQSTTNDESQSIDWGCESACWDVTNVTNVTNSDTGPGNLVVHREDDDMDKSAIPGQTVDRWPMNALSKEHGATTCLLKPYTPRVQEELGRNHDAFKPCELVSLELSGSR